MLLYRFMAAIWNRVVSHVRTSADSNRFCSKPAKRLTLEFLIAVFKNQCHSFLHTCSLCHWTTAEGTILYGNAWKIWFGWLH